MRTSASRSNRLRLGRIGIGAGIGIGIGLLMAGCPANVTGSVVPVQGELVGITVAPKSGPVSGGTVVTFTSPKGGFDAGTSILFGEESATDVRVYNGNVMTAVAPPGSPGAAKMRLHAPVDSQLRVMIDAQGLGTVKLNERNAVVVDVGDFDYYVVPPGDDTDTDGDGLSDEQEIAGWEVWTEQFGLGLGVDTFGNVTRYLATSDPQAWDTDDDGLSDRTEFLIRSDPNAHDSDGDGLWDGEEWNQWLTSPTSVDTDSDARGDRNLQNAPNQALFDGMELFNPYELYLPPGDPDRKLKLRATSPTLADTDGDGVGDFDEFDSTVRNGVVSDLPLLEYKLVDDVDVRLKVEYAETIGETREYGVTLTESQTETESSSFSASVGFSFEVMVGVEVALGMEEGLPTASTTLKTEATAGINSEFTYTNTKESSHESSKELSRVESDSREFTEAASEGEIRTAIELTNGGNSTFTVDGLGVLVSLHEKKKMLGDITPPARKTIATMTPAFESITLAPGETAGPFELAATGVNAQAIKDLLAAPDTLMLGTAAMNFRDSNGLDFDYVRQFTVAQTALVIIDFNDKNIPVRQYNVATNVDRDASSNYRGITLEQALRNLGIPRGNSITGFTMMDNPLQAEGYHNKVLASLLGKQYEERSGMASKYWTVVANEGVEVNVDFNNIVLQAGDFVHLAFKKDSDGDGLSDDIEKAAGTDVNVDPDNPSDADADGLSDYFEVLKGWVVFADPDDSGEQWGKAGTATASTYRTGHEPGKAEGAPDTTEYSEDDGDVNQKTWTPTASDSNQKSHKNGTLDWLDIQFDKLVYASGVTIRETAGNGFVYKVDVLNNGTGKLENVWTGNDPSLPGRPENFRVNWPTTDFLTRRVRIYIDTNANLNSFEGIDAVALHGYADKRAYRVMSDPRFADADGDGLNDADEYAGATDDPAKSYSSDPLDPDTDDDGLIDSEDPYPTIPAKTIYVKADGVVGGNWPSVYTTVHAAIEAAKTGQASKLNPNDDVSQIWVAAGEYKPSARLTPMSLVKNVGIYGGFAGPDGVSFPGETKRGQRNTNPFTNGCIVTGDLGGDDTGEIRLDVDDPNRDDNCPTLFVAGGGDSTAILDGFMLTGAYKKSGDTAGGAFRAGTSVYPTIQNCLFIGNGTRGWGAAVRVADGPKADQTMRFDNCIFANNVSWVGGAAYVEIDKGGTIAFEDCQFSNNESRSQGSQYDSVTDGGAVYATNYGNVHFTGCTFSGNQTLDNGGAIYTTGNIYARIDRCRFFSNFTTNTPEGTGSGGGVFLTYSASVFDSVFWDNRSTGGNGGGIAVVYIGHPVSVAITNCTLVDNRCRGGWDGGGIYVNGNANCSVGVKNTVLWQNWMGNGVLPKPEENNENKQIWWNNNPVLTVRNSCVLGLNRFRGTSNIADDPSFTNLDLGDLTLSDQSPCIDRGDTFVDLEPWRPGITFLPVFDLTGKLRIVDGNSDGVATVDMGAFEVPAPK